MIDLNRKNFLHIFLHYVYDIKVQHIKIIAQIEMKLLQ